MFNTHTVSRLYNTRKILYLFLILHLYILFFIFKTKDKRRNVVEYMGDTIHTE